MAHLPYDEIVVTGLIDFFTSFEFSRTRVAFENAADQKKRETGRSAPQGFAGSFQLMFKPTPTTPEALYHGLVGLFQSNGFEGPASTLQQEYLRRGGFTQLMLARFANRFDYAMEDSPPLDPLAMNLGSEAERARELARRHLIALGVQESRDDEGVQPRATKEDRILQQWDLERFYFSPTTKLRGVSLAKKKNPRKATFLNNINFFLANMDMWIRTDISNVDKHGETSSSFFIKDDVWKSIVANWNVQVGQNIRVMEYPSGNLHLSIV